ncbi:hypothetical protein [uncultured Maribacter sp.]|uniref:hypothetical protein n=1 Tax=uncultured Maribacter sp. TaxID=431308 RepID=UPI002602868E|nr:hypothetical protein [uncultured Maribacter sp.]
MTTIKEKAPVWFWMVSGLALLWNLAGVGAYLQHAYMSIEDLEKLSQAERLLYESQPSWVTAAFAIAVWGGTLGCIALLLRKKWAKPILLISLIGVLAQMGHSFFMTNSFEVYGPGAMIMPIMVIIIAIALVFFARKSLDRKWIA